MLVLQLFLQQPKISLVLPVYNQEKYLNETLTQLTQQTFKNFEIICVNDQSTDSSVQIIERFRKGHKNIKLVHQPQNQGALSTRALGIRESTGEYIIMFDPDDRMVSERVLEELVFKSQNSIADIFHFRERYFTFKNNSWFSQPYQWANPQHAQLYNVEILNAFMNEQLSHIVHGKMIKRSVYLKAIQLLNGILNQQITFGDDYALMFAVCAQAKSYKAIDVIGYDYYVHGDSVMLSASNNIKKSLKFFKDNSIVFNAAYQLANAAHQKRIAWKYTSSTKRVLDTMGQYTQSEKMKLCAQADQSFISNEQFQEMTNTLCRKIERLNTDEKDRIKG
ncbi:Glycosyl_transferase family 2 protein [Hexamita inflata]|uniref:Glycosyl transferase family 2 protein n=1 Tax=Hexamita inflata TaxID=28002 RepID=A0AA86P8F7_9EUKA|nr:Glycosyl transferase family 2 protein [Hexamita inflata]